MSSGMIEHPVRPLDVAADYFGFGRSLRSSPAHVCFDPRVITRPDDNYAMESGVGLAIATAVETMLVGLTG